MPSDCPVISDALDARTMMAEYGVKQVVLASFAASVDVLLIGPGPCATQAVYCLLDAARSGRIDEAEFDRRVLGILRLKTEYFGR